MLPSCSGYDEREKTMSTMIFITMVFGIGRIWLGFTEDPRPASIPGSFEALAHVYVGMLLMDAINNSLQYKKRNLLNPFFWQWYLFWGVCGIEVLVAITSRMV